MRTKITLLFIVFIFISGNSIAQKKYTLKECVEYARENNLTVKQSSLNVQTSEINKNTQFGNFLPDANLNSGYALNQGFSIDPTTNTVLNTKSNSFSFNATSQWNLFDGMKNYNQYRKSKLDLLAAQYNLEQIKDDISLQVADAYLQIILNIEYVEVAKKQVVLSEKEVDRISNFVESGSKAKGDLYEVQATLANDEQQLISTENNLLLSRLSLTQLLQIEYSDDFQIDDSEFPIPTVNILEKSSKEVFQKALETQYIIKSYENKIFSAEKDLSIAKGSYSPSLSLVYQFSSRYLKEKQRTILSGNYAPMPIGITQGSREIVETLMPQPIPSGYEQYPFWDQLNDGKGQYLGVNLRIPIFNKFQVRNNVRVKKIQLEQARIEMDIQKNKLRQNIEKAQADANGALKTYRASEKSLESLNEAFKYAQQKREVGMISEYDFNQSRYRLVQAESTMLRTKYEFIFKVKVLEYYFGEGFGLNI